MTRAELLDHVRATYPPPAWAADRPRLALLPDCEHLGERLPGEPCGSTLRRCNLDGAACSKYTPCRDAARVCQSCTLRPDPPGFVTVPQPPPLDLQPTRPRALVTVVVGDEARACFASGGPHMARYAERVNADLVVLDWPGAAAWPMSAKFAIGRVLDHYERIAHVDADVLLRPAAVNLFDLCAADELGIADELPHHRLNPAFGRELAYQRFRATMGFARVPHLPWYGNAGVMVVPRSHQALLMPPARPLPVGHCSEQDHTNAVLLDSGTPYRLIDRRGNWQSWTDHGFRAAPPDAVLHWSGAGKDRVSRAEQMRKWAARFPW